MGFLLRCVRPDHWKTLRPQRVEAIVDRNLCRFLFMGSMSVNRLNGSNSISALRHFSVKARTQFKTQVWIAITTYLLVAIMKKRVGLDATLYQILQVLSVSLFEKTPILQAFQHQDDSNSPDDSSKQLKVLDL